MLGEYDAMERRERVVGHTGIMSIEPASEVSLPPGEKEEQWVGMWAFRDPLPPGKYSFSASHEVTAGSHLASARVPFEIRPGRVESMALSFDGPARLNSITAWISKMEGSANPRLLIRQSGFTSHAVTQVGATSNGEFAEGSLVALSAMPADARFPPFNWAAVVSGSTVQLVQHSMGIPAWRSPAIPLNLSGAIPIQRFPNRGHAVFLATVAGSSGGALVGAVVKRGDTSPHVWKIQLQSRPVQAACAFEMAGAITVLYSNTEGATSRLHRLDVSEDGQLLKPETVVRESRNRVLSIVADLRPEQPASFIVLEEDTARANLLGFSRFPINGSVSTSELREMPGWPMAESHGVKIPERAANIGFDLDIGGTPWLAITLQDGRFYGGRLDGSLAELFDGEKQRCSFPHPAGVAKSMTLSCFLENGMMFHSGGGGGH
jgi:hypothetical protein